MVLTAHRTPAASAETSLLPVCASLASRKISPYPCRVLRPPKSRLLRVLRRSAAFGRGLETVVDTAVRKCLEVNLAAVQFENPAWEDGFKVVLGEALEGLGLRPEDGQAELYKVLLYEPGGTLRLIGTQRRQLA